MHPYRIITARDLADYEAALAKGGFDKADFDIEEDVFDPRKAEVEAALGEVGVHRHANEAVEVYRLGPGFEWVSDFADDLRNGKFGAP